MYPNPDPTDQPVVTSPVTGFGSQPSNQSRAKKIALVAAGLVLIGLIIALIVMLLRQPSNEDYTTLRKSGLSSAESSQDKLQEAANAYLKGFGAQLNVSNNVPEAETKLKERYDAFKQSEKEARASVAALASSKATNDEEVDEAAEALSDVYEERITYLSTIVEHYPKLQSIFGGANNDVCNDIFLGETSNFEDRKRRLSAAAENCYTALKELAASGNESYRDFALKVERRVKTLEKDVTIIIATEKRYNDFVKKKNEFEAQYAALEQRNAPDAEFEALAKKIDDVNVQVKDNQADFDDAAKESLATTKELPTVYRAVFSTEVPRKIKHFETLAKIRATTLQSVLDDKVATR